MLWTDTVVSVCKWNSQNINCKTLEAATSKNRRPNRDKQATPNQMEMIFSLWDEQHASRPWVGSSRMWNCEMKLGYMLLLWLKRVSRNQDAKTEYIKIYDNHTTSPSLVNLIMSPRIVICIQILPPCHIFYHPLCHEMKPIYKSFSLWFVKWNWWTSESWMACLNNWAVLNQTTLGSGSGTAIWNNYHMTADYTWVLPPQGLHV